MMKYPSAAYFMLAMAVLGNAEAQKPTERTTRVVQTAPRKPPVERKEPPITVVVSVDGTAKKIEKVVDKPNNQL